MKNMLLLICYLVGICMLLAFFFSFANYLFGWHLSVKGAEVPGDPLAAVVFLGIGVLCLAISYLVNRKPKSKRTN